MQGIRWRGVEGLKSLGEDVGDPILLAESDVARTTHFLQNQERYRSLDVLYDPLTPLGGVNAHTMQLCAAQLNVLKNISDDVHFFTIDTTACHEAGANPAEEIAKAIHDIFCFCEEMRKHGISAHDVMRRVTVRMALGQDPLLQAAKIQALRVLWDRTMGLLDAGHPPVVIHAQCSKRMMTTQDPWDNVLRVTAAVLASHLGGVTSMDTACMAPYLPTTLEHAETILLHVFHVIALESGLGKHTDDVLAGSGVVEQWIENLCVHAWHDMDRRSGLK
jgi:methylmalonyl-CoA mutase N-terminal domain/subunit